MACTFSGTQSMLNRLAVFGALLVSAPGVAGSLYVGGELGVAATDDDVNSAPTLPCGANCLPSEVSLDGLRLDAQETAWSLFAGWAVRDWLSLELAYTNLGEPEDFREPGAPLLLHTLPPGVVAVVDPDAFFGEVPPAAGIAVGQAIDFGSVALGIEEVSVNVVFRHALAKSFSAWWSLGLSLATFEARGYYETIEIVSFQPTVWEMRQIPFATPDDETGYRWGFGAEYTLNERFGLELGYRRHELQVVDTETLSLRFLIRL